MIWCILTGTAVCIAGWAFLVRNSVRDMGDWMKRRNHR